MPCRPRWETETDEGRLRQDDPHSTQQEDKREASHVDPQRERRHPEGDDRALLSCLQQDEPPYDPHRDGPQDDHQVADDEGKVGLELQAPPAARHSGHPGPDPAHDHRRTHQVGRSGQEEAVPRHPAGVGAQKTAQGSRVGHSYRSRKPMWVRKRARAKTYEAHTAATDTNAA